MYKTILACVCASALLLLPMYSTLAYSKGATSHTFRVELSVHSKNHDLKNRIISLASSELRTLGDVMVTSNKPEYKITIIAQPVQAVAGYKLGIVVTVIITEQGANWGWALSKTLPEKLRNNIIKSTTSNDIFLNTELFVGQSSALRENLASIIANFDVHQLKQMRQFYNSINSKTSK